jgi:acyl dehydratase
VRQCPHGRNEQDLKVSPQAGLPVALSLAEIAGWPRGQLAVTDWLTLDKEQLGLFAKATRLTPDAVDVTISANNRWGPELVDGFLLVGLLVHFQWGAIALREQGAWGLNYGLERVRFPAPAFVGERVRDHIELLDASERSSGQILVKTRHTIEIEGQSKPALVADWLCLFLIGDVEIVR